MLILSKALYKADTAQLLKVSISLEQCAGACIATGFDLCSGLSLRYAVLSWLKYGTKL